MKEVLAISFALNLVLAAGRLWKERDVHAEGGKGGGVPVGNGEVNGSLHIVRAVRSGP